MTWQLITTRLLDLRKRRALMIVTVLFTIGVPVIILGVREVFHVANPRTYGPAGSPGIFSGVGSEMAEFGFIIALVVGATAGTTDLTSGVFRYLVITGRSRLALFFARIPAGLAILLPLAAAGYAIVCLVTAFMGAPQPSSIDEGGAAVPVHLSQVQLQTWIVDHPAQSGIAFGTGQPQSPAAARVLARQLITPIYAQYAHDEATQLNPSVRDMTDAGLWIELDLVVGFSVGLGLGTLMGQRTVPVILLLVLDIVITPRLAGNTLPYFINVQRADVGIAMAQLQPQALIGQSVIGHLLNHGDGQLANQAIARGLVMPAWALVTVIAGWIIGWTALGAWRMVTRDA